MNDGLSATTVKRFEPTIDELRLMYRRMLLIRRFEEQSSRLYKAGHIPGFLHTSVGQEASAVGACHHLRADDIITSTHRGHGHTMAKGLEAEEMFAELMGKETGVCRGRGGSMHIADPRRGIFGANGIVGAGLPIANGAALATRLRGSDNVVVAFLGDGAISTGAFHESLNLAALWKLPVVYWCENNRFSEFSSFDEQHPVGIEQRAIGYGVPFVAVDGNDVVATTTVMGEILDRLRSDRFAGPVLVESSTLRVSGHYEGDPQLYRDGADDGDVSDPLQVARAHLERLGESADSLDAIEREVEAEIEQAMTGAKAAPLPRAEDLYHGMSSRRPLLRLVDRSPEPVKADDDTPTWKMFQAIHDALEFSLEENPDVFLAGIDVGKGGNVFGLTRGIHQRWPDRVLDTPISEMAIMGLATGAGMAGMSPVVELMYFDFLGVCLDQLMNQAAKLPYMTGGRASMNITVRTQFGAGRSSGAQHSQSLEAMLAHIPGLTVVMPSTPSDAYGLLRSAIEDPNPVVFVENRLQYGQRGERCDRDHRVPLGQAAYLRRGSDVTIVSYSRMAQACCDAVDQLAAEGISCDLIDLRTIAPLDVTGILESVARTSRLVIVHEATRDFGVGAEIAARMADEGLLLLDAPVRRIAAQYVPAPYSPSLEAEWMPSTAQVVDAARELVRW